MENAVLINDPVVNLKAIAVSRSRWLKWVNLVNEHLQCGVALSHLA